MSVDTEGCCYLGDQTFQSAWKEMRTLVAPNYALFPSQGRHKPNSIPIPAQDFGGLLCVWTRVRRGLWVGAGRGSRTPKGRSPADFESAASASSAIPAQGKISHKVSIRPGLNPHARHQFEDRLRWN